MNYRHEEIKKRQTIIIKTITRHEETIIRHEDDLLVRRAAKIQVRLSASAASSLTVHCRDAGPVCIGVGG